MIGLGSLKLRQKSQSAGYQDYECVETMDRAVQRAAELGTAKAAKVVLLSPACASFDQYQSFEHRGDHFRQLCLQL